MTFVPHVNEAMERTRCEYHGQACGCAAFVGLGESQNIDGWADAIRLGVLSFLYLAGITQT